MVSSILQDVDFVTLKIMTPEELNDYACEYGWTIDNPFVDDALEKLALEYGFSYAKMMASRHHTNVRWVLHYEELYGDLLEELAKSLKKYLLCELSERKPWNEYLKLVRMMMWNRVRELYSYSNTEKRGAIKQEDGSIRYIEFTAHVLNEDYDYYDDRWTVGGWTTGCRIEPYMLSEFTDTLSPLARKIVESVLDPDENMQQAIGEYIQYRATLYKNGAGIGGDKSPSIPPKVVAKALDLEVGKVKEMYAEVTSKLYEDDKEKGTMNTAVALGQPDFAGSLVVWKDRQVEDQRYSQWGKFALQDQVKFRELCDTVSGMRRSLLIFALRLNDLANGRDLDTNEKEVQEKLNGLNKTDKDLLGQKLLASVASPTREVAAPPKTNGKTVAKVEVVEEPETEDAYEDFGPKTDVKLHPEDAKEDVASDNVKIKKTKDDDDGNGMLGKHQTDADPFIQLLQAMREGETLNVTRTGSNSWNFELVSPSNDHKVAKSPSTVKVDTEKTSDETENGKFKKGSKGWKQELMSPEYLEFVDWKKNLNDNEKFLEIAKEEGAEWDYSDNVRVNLRGAFKALREKRGISKWKPKYQGRDSRKAVTI